MNTIVLLPLGNADRNAVRDLADPLARTFDAQVNVREIPLDLDEFLDPVRQQYNSSRLLQHLSANARALIGTPRGARRPPKALGIVAEDLFTPILTFVFGEAELRGQSAVVSYHRFPAERYGLAPDPVLLTSRFRKEAVHELGHTYGLLHCEDQECVMHVSTDVEDIDLKGDLFCRECNRLLRSTRHTRVP